MRTPKILQGHVKRRYDIHHLPELLRDDKPYIQVREIYEVFVPCFPVIERPDGTLREFIPVSCYTYLHHSVSSPYEVDKLVDQLKFEAKLTPTVEFEMSLDRGHVVARIPELSSELIVQEFVHATDECEDNTTTLTNKAMWRKILDRVVEATGTPLHTEDRS